MAAGIDHEAEPGRSRVGLHPKRFVLDSQAASAETRSACRAGMLIEAAHEATQTFLDGLHVSGPGLHGSP
jgi:hypothetical protein